MHVSSGEDRRALREGETRRRIRLVDATRIEGPGNRVWRLHMCYDPGLARIIDASLTTTREGERLDRLRVTPNEVRLGDRAYPHPDGIKNTIDAGGDVLVRLTWKSLQLKHPSGAALDWMKLFAAAKKDSSLDIPVELHKSRSRFEPIALRLVIIKKPAEAATKARKKARRASAKNGRKIDPRTTAAADFVIYLTSLDREDHSAAEIASLYRMRWQACPREGGDRALL